MIKQERLDQKDMKKNNTHPSIQIKAHRYTIYIHSHPHKKKKQTCKWTGIHQHVSKQYVFHD